MHTYIQNRAEGRLEESDRLKRAALEQRSQSDLVDQNHNLAEIARLQEANRDLERERRELHEERKKAREKKKEKDGEARSTEKALEKTRRYEVNQESSMVPI